jgi:short-subunit dehydrogenase
MTRTAIVTGASRGIGRTIAGRLAAEGWGLLLSGRDPSGLNNAVAALAGSPAAAVRGVAGDMSNPADVEALARVHYDYRGELELLVLAAGVGAGGRIRGIQAEPA